MMPSERPRPQQQREARRDQHEPAFKNSSEPMYLMLFHCSPAAAACHQDTATCLQMSALTANVSFSTVIFAVNDM